MADLNYFGDATLPFKDGEDPLSATNAELETALEPVGKICECGAYPHKPHNKGCKHIVPPVPLQKWGELELVGQETDLPKWKTTTGWFS
jgi:hypothetical protein